MHRTQAPTIKVTASSRWYATSQPLANLFIKRIHRTATLIRPGAQYSN